MGKVEDAIILAGGRGTRMLPASLFMPKEMMPLVDTPVLNHLIWEASRAGATRVHLVLSPLKMGLLSNHLGNVPVNGPEVRVDLPREAVNLGLDGIEIFVHIQKSSKGVADAISVALPFVSGPFLVLLGDNLLMSEHLGPKYSGLSNASNASKMLVEQFDKSGLPCVGVYPVESDELEKYGVVGISEGLVTTIVEKPSKGNEPSNYILCGRYLMPENTQSIIDIYPVSKLGELQSISLLKHLIKNEGLKAVKLDHTQMYDSGEPISWLKSQVDHALRRGDIGSDFSYWLKNRMSSRED